MALQVDDLRKIAIEPWKDVKAEAEARVIVDEIEPRIDYDLSNLAQALPPDHTAFLVRCPEANNRFVLEEIKKRYYSWDMIRRWEDDLVFYTY